MTVSLADAPIAILEDRRRLSPLSSVSSRPVVTDTAGNGMGQPAASCRSGNDAQIHSQHTSHKNRPSQDGLISYTKDSVFHNRVELYRGSVSVIYKAVCATSKREVIVKAYKIHRMTPKQIHKAKREIELMQVLRGDSGVVRYLGHFEDPVMTFIVMEYCSKGDLFRLLFLKGGHVDEPWAVGMVIKPMLEVLIRLHSRNILHRDIKPENIFFSSNWQLKLGDFGLAVDANQEHPFTRSGTLDYMAPEVLANPATDLVEGPSLPLARLVNQSVKPYNHKVDVWAVGILAYELVVGKPPFEVENEQYTMKLIMKSNRINLPPKYSADWADFVSMALRKRPEERPSCLQLLQHPWILKHTNPSAWRARIMAQACVKEAGSALKALSLMPSVAPADSTNQVKEKDGSKTARTLREYAVAQQPPNLKAPRKSSHQPPSMPNQQGERVAYPLADTHAVRAGGQHGVTSFIVAQSPAPGGGARPKSALPSPGASSSNSKPRQHQQVGIPAGVLHTATATQEQQFQGSARPLSAHAHVAKSSSCTTEATGSLIGSIGNTLQEAVDTGTTGQDHYQGLRSRIKQYFQRQMGSNNTNMGHESHQLHQSSATSSA